MAYTMALRSLCRKGRFLQNASLLSSDSIPLAATNGCRLINTSKGDKNIPISTTYQDQEYGDHRSINQGYQKSLEEIETSEEYKRLKKHFGDTSDNEDNYEYFGFNTTDRDDDWFEHNFRLFFGVCFISYWSFFILFYRPDHKMQDWVCREAWLQLERREREGLPLIDINYIDPKLMILPTEEELGDTQLTL